MDGVEGGEGEQPGAGRDCPAPQPFEAKGGGPSEIVADGERLRFVQGTEEERAAITRLLKNRADSAPASVGSCRASALAWAALKIAAMVLLAAGVGTGLADGDEFDDAGCSVAHQPGGTCHRARSAQDRERGDDDDPGSGDGSAGSDGGGTAGRQECGMAAVTKTVGAAMERLEAKLEAVLAAVAGRVEPDVPVSEREAQRVFQLMRHLEGGPRQSKAPLGAVFRLTVLEGHSQAKIARSCECVPALISRRVKTIESQFGMSIEQLRNFASVILEMEASVKGDKTRKRKGGAAGDEPAQYGEDDDG